MAKLRLGLFACLVTALSAGPLVAQTGSITGRVVDEATSLGVEQAAVAVQGMPGVVLTDAQGNFTITGIPVGNQQVTVRYIGYGPVTQAVTVRAGQASTVMFNIRRQAIALEELVVTGYGAQRRVAITGSVASIDADEANVGVVTNADEMIQGRVAGVNITQNNGEPGSGTQIRIRGGTSISASNEPLYVIDGVPVLNVPAEPGGIGIGGDPALARNPLNLINPNDIENITILKDAAAAAIYGAQSANGVVLIETKQGERDRVGFEYNGYVSVASAARSLDLLNGAEYRQFIQQQVNEGNLDASRLDGLGSANTDWEKEVLRTAVTHNHNIAFTGGTESTRYRASLNYMNQEGVALSSALERFQARLNGTHYAWDDRLQLRLNLTASHVSNDYVPFEDTGGFEGGVFQNVAVFNPTFPVMVTDQATSKKEFFEIGGGRQSVRNPVGVAEQTADFSGTTRVLANLRTQLDITDNLQGQLSIGVDRNESTRRTYFPGSSPVGAEWNGRALQENREITATTLQGLLTYNRSFGGSHNVEVVGGYEFAEFTIDGFGTETRDFLTDAFSFDNLTAGAQPQPPFSSAEKSRLIGVFGRLTYGYQDKYFLTGVFRRDGSSKFGADNKWASFPAISASWRISEEEFARGGLFSELRLRAGYGVQGNEAVAPYSSLILLEPSDGASYPFGEVKTVGVAPVTNPNAAIKWEQTSQFNVAIDYGFADNRFAGSFEYYIKNTDDLLLEVTVPQPAIASTRLQNIGEVRNVGFEATFDALLFNTSGFTWDAGLVFSAVKNEVKNLGGRSFITSGFVSGQGQSGQVSQRILPGFALGTFYGPEFVGVDDQGRQLFNDYDDNGSLVGQTTTLADNDFVPIGDANPDFTFALRNQMTFGNFDASVLLRAAVGLDVFNNTALVYQTKSNALQDKNFLRAALNDPDAITQPAIFSSRWIEDASFLRLQNITIGYTFELPRYFIGAGRTARAYVSSDNLFLLTGYSGYDPEAHSDAGIASRGIDYLSYPRTRTFTAGIGFQF